MSNFITDTHALIWYLVGSSRLGSEARAHFDSAVEGESQIFIPAIVVAELIMFGEKHKTIAPDKIFTKLRETPGFEFLPLLPETAEAIQPLTALSDIHDRLIVAEAMAQNMPLLSFDRSITKSKLVKVIW